MQSQKNSFAVYHWNFDAFVIWFWESGFHSLTPYSVFTERSPFSLWFSGFQMKTKKNLCSIVMLSIYRFESCSISHPTYHCITELSLTYFSPLSHRQSPRIIINHINWKSLFYLIDVQWVEKKIQAKKIFFF